MANNVTSIALLGSNDILLLFSCFCLQGSGPKMCEIAKFIDNGKNFALPLILRVNQFYHFYQFLTIQIINPSYVSSFCC